MSKVECRLEFHIPDSGKIRLQTICKENFYLECGKNDTSFPVKLNFFNLKKKKTEFSHPHNDITFRQSKHRFPRPTVTYTALHLHHTLGVKLNLF